MTPTSVDHDRSSQLLAIIERLYDAVGDLDKWPAFLELATKLFAARGAQVGHTDLVNSRLSFSVVHGYDWSAEHMQRYERLMSEDPRIPYFSANPFKAVHCRMSLSDEQLHASRVYKEVLSIGGVEYSLGVNLVEDTRTLTYFLVLRDRSQPPFSDADCEQMAALIPHLGRALKLQRDLGLLAMERSAGFNALDNMAIGIIIIDADARIQFANDAARRIAAAADGLRFAAERLVIDRGDGANIQARARRLIQSTLSGSSTPGEAFRVPRPSGREAYAALISTSGHNQGRFGWNQFDEPLAIVYVRDPDQPDETRAEILQRLYGLMPSQARLADLLATGASLTAAAKRLGITPASARQYLKLIFQKTGTHRQVELVRKVLLVPTAPAAQRSAGARAQNERQVAICSNGNTSSRSARRHRGLPLP
jgi:DNA-binding CsgD family transcriptional regulator/PAS domain-containing protein